MVSVYVNDVCVRKPAERCRRYVDPHVRSPLFVAEHAFNIFRLDIVMFPQGVFHNIYIILMNEAAVYQADRIGVFFSEVVPSCHLFFH